MTETVVGRTAEYIARSAGQASRATSVVADAVQDRLGVVKRAAERGSDTAEELLSDATERVHHHLPLTVACTFAVGIAAGTIIGLMMKRK